MVVQLVVDDTSPQIVYSPFGDTFSSPNTLAGWNPYYSLSGFASFQGEVGNGSSSHITSLDGAVLSVEFHGTNIQLLGNSSEATYITTLDGTPQPVSSAANNVLASFSGLSDADHILSLTFHSTPPSNESYLTFDKALITLPESNLTTSGNQSFEPINENYISFMGQWTIESQGQGDLVSSFHQSSKQGDIAMAMFKGSAFKLLGVTSPTAATYTVLLKPQSPNSNSPSITRTLSARSSFEQDNSLLFFVSGLNESETYSVQVSNLDAGLLALSVNGFEVLGNGVPPVNQPPTEPPEIRSSDSSSYPPGTIAALALSGILLFLFISSLLFYFLIWRPRARRESVERPTIRQKERESGEVIIIQREKYVESDDVLGGPSPPDPRNFGSSGRRVRPDDVVDNAPFPFSFVPRDIARSGSVKAHTSRGSYSNIGVDEDPVSPESKSLSKMAKNKPISSPQVPPPKTGDNSQDNYNKGSEHLDPRPTTVDSQVSTQAPSIFEGSQTCEACRGDLDSEIPRIETRTVAHDETTRDPEAFPASPISDDQELEYVDFEYVIDAEGDAPPRVAQKSSRVVEDPGVQPTLHHAKKHDEEQESDDQEPVTPFLEVRESSPFRVDFPRHFLKSSRASGSRTRHSGSRVRFQDELTDKESDDNSALVPPVLPPTIQFTPPTASLPLERNAVTSFLDLSASPPGSLRTHSSSGSSRRGQPPERSRWSSTTSQSAYTNPSNMTGRSSRGNEDFRWSMPTSPRIFPFRLSLHPPRIRRSIQSREQRSPEIQPPANLPPPSSPPPTHPFTFAEAGVLPSPTHSVPTTISDLHFRHSISDDASRVESRGASTSPHLPPHPPLPSGFSEPRRHQRERSSLSQISSSLANQPNIVQRVLGLQSPGSQPSSTLGRVTSTGGMSRSSSTMGRRFRP